MSLAIKAGRASSQGGRAGSVRSGDPGLFGSIFDFGKKLVGLGARTLPIVGPAIGAIQDRPRSPSVPRGGLGLPTPGVPAPRFGGGRTATSLVTGFDAGLMTAAAGCPSGMHPNKSDYFLRDGTFVPEGSRCVKNRRRNPLNPRAASRAISRIVSAKKATKALGRITVRKKHVGGHA